MPEANSAPDFENLYRGFASPITALDCGKLCAPINPTGKPFCCDICQAVPVAYKPEWRFLREKTKLWHVWRGDECAEKICDPSVLEEDTPEHLLLLACDGPDHCLRDYRTISCRQFPFFPYITSDFRFIGLTLDWEFHGKCWILDHLEQVTGQYRQEFVHTFDRIFSVWRDDLESYHDLSEEAREYYQSSGKPMPLLHRDGQNYLLNPENETFLRG